MTFKKMYHCGTMSFKNLNLFWKVFLFNTLKCLPIDFKINAKEKKNHNIKIIFSILEPWGTSFDGVPLLFTLQHRPMRMLHLKPFASVHFHLQPYLMTSIHNCVCTPLNNCAKCRGGGGQGLGPFLCNHKGCMQSCPPPPHRSDHYNVHLVIKYSWSSGIFRNCSSHSMLLQAKLHWMHT